MSALSIRPMMMSDAGTAYAIEQRVMASPWTKSSFNDCFESHYFNWVAEQNNCIVGYMIASIIFDEGQLLKIAVDTVHQRQGVAEALIKILLAKSLKSIWLEVAASNQAAIAFYKKNGFKKISVRKNYYITPRGAEDAWVMCR